MESDPEEKKDTEAKKDNKCCFVKWYYEVDGDSSYKGSGVEVVMFYFSMLATLAFCGFTWHNLDICEKFQYKYLLLLIPLAIWMFPRCSRKDMKATAYLIAGLFGAFGGALVVILQKIK